MASMQQWLESCETDFLLFSKTVCPYCTMAKNILKAKGFTFTEVNTEHHDGLRDDVIRETGHRTVPVCFDLRGDEPRFVGGSDHLMEYLA